MAIFGANLGRTSTGYTAGRLLDFIGSKSDRIDVLARQLAGGIRILNPSMDPLGTSNWLGQDSVMRRNDQFQKNVESLTNRYNFADSQLGEAANILNQLKVIAIRESNDFADSSTRAASANEVQQLRTSLLQIANSQFAGQNIFGGQKLQGAAFEGIGESIRFLGTDTLNHVQVGEGVTIEATVDARPVFGVRENVIEGTTNLNATATLAITSPPATSGVSTPLSALNEGHGVDLGGQINIEVRPDPASAVRFNYQVDIGNAQTIEDVIVSLRNVRDETGAQVFSADLFNAQSASYPQNLENVASGIKLEVESGGPLDGILNPGATIKISDDVGRSTARDLGLLTTSSVHKFASEDLTAQAPFVGPMTFNVEMNGFNTPITVSPAMPQSLADLATAMNTELTNAAALSGQSGLSINVVANNTTGKLEFDIQNTGSGEYIEITGTNNAARDLHIEHASSIIGPAHTIGAVQFDEAFGIRGTDLSPALNTHTRLSDLFGGAGMALETDLAGNTRLPQGVRITNGQFQVAVDMSSLLSNPDSTIEDLQNAFKVANASVELQLDGDNVKLVSLLSGTALKIEDLNGTLGSQLGLATNVTASRLDDLNNGLGIDAIDGIDFTLTTRSSVNVEIDFGDASDISGIADTINADAQNVNPSGTPATFFTASVLRQRTFESNTIVDPTAAISINASFNGKPSEAITVAAQAGRSLAVLATQLESAMQQAADRSGLQGYSVNIAEDSGTGNLDFRVEDESGVARIQIAGADAAALGFMGNAFGADNQTQYAVETVSDRLAIVDNTFDINTYVAGDSISTFSQSSGAGTLDDLGLNGFDPSTGRFISNDLALRGTGSEGLFNTLADMIAALNAGSATAIGRGIDRLQNALTSVLNGRAEAGSKGQRLQMTKNRLAVENSNLAALASNIMDTDMAVAAQEFQQTQTILQAGLTVTAQIGRISIIDFL